MWKLPIRYGIIGITDNRYTHSPKPSNSGGSSINLDTTYTGASSCQCLGVPKSGRVGAGCSVPGRVAQVTMCMVHIVGGPMPRIGTFSGTMCVRNIAGRGRGRGRLQSERNRRRRRTMYLPPHMLGTVGAELLVGTKVTWVFWLGSWRYVRAESSGGVGRGGERNFRGVKEEVKEANT